jgi:hypothetical protein
MNTTNLDWSREAHRTGRVQMPNYTPRVIATQALRSTAPNRRVNLPNMIAHQVERTIAMEPQRQIAPMMQLPVIRILRAIREMLT